jgi:tRNA G18 (ribose-2'-O)-methylase SpoU
MPGAVTITDPADSRLALYAGVRDPVLARSAGCFVAEGRFVVRRVIESGAYRVRSLLLTETAARELGDALPALPGDVPVFLAGLDLVRAVTGFNIDRGCLALVERPAARDARDLVATLPSACSLLILEDVANPDNVGGAFRNAAAFGVAAVLLNAGCSDPLYRKAVRTSMAATLSVPYARVDPWPVGIEQLKKSGTHVLALAPHDGEALSEWCRRPNRPSRVALLIGNEGEGLSASALACADEVLRIPMADGMDSLNAATSAAVALYAITQT